MSKQNGGYGGATAEQIKQWKEKHPDGVYAIKVRGRIAYFKHPSFKELDYYSAKSQETDSVSESWKALAETCFIGGDELLRDNVLYLPTVHAALKEKIFDREAELVNL